MARYKRGRPIPIGGGLYELKPLCDLVHERLIARPFRPLSSFGMEGFVDYGQPHHDQNAPFDSGRKFRRAMWVNKKREEARRAGKPR